MSLKAFHIFFIVISILLAFGFAGWMIMNYSSGGGALMLLGSLASILAGIALALYGIRFLRKLKHVSYL